MSMQPEPKKLMRWDGERWVPFTDATLVERLAALEARVAELERVRPSSGPSCAAAVLDVLLSGMDEDEAEAAREQLRRLERLSDQFNTEFERGQP